MFHSRYELKITGKDTKRFLQQLRKKKIYFEQISFQKEVLFVCVDEENYQKIKQEKTIYTIETEKIHGLAYLKKGLFKHRYFFLCFFASLCLLLFLSHIIFAVEVVHSKEEIRTFLLRELKQYDISPYHFVKNYQDKEKIKEAILEKNKDRLEWIEFERRGVKYYIRVEERIIKKEPEATPPQNIVAKKDGILLKIEASSGEIVKPIHTYVRKGDVIISGQIKKDDTVVNTVTAKGKIFAEVWYQVEVTIPKHYYEEQKTGKSHFVLNMSLLGKEYQLFPWQKYAHYKEKETTLISDPLNFFQLSFGKQEQLNIIDETYTIDTSYEKINQIAREKVLSYIGKEGNILSQKNLKIIEKNSTIISTVFFKVSEDITATSEITEEENLNKEENGSSR